MKVRIVLDLDLSVDLLGRILAGEDVTIAVPDAAKTAAVPQEPARRCEIDASPVGPVAESPDRAPKGSTRGSGGFEAGEPVGYGRDGPVRLTEEAVECSGPVCSRKGNGTGYFYPAAGETMCPRCAGRSA